MARPRILEWVIGGGRDGHSVVDDLRSGQAGALLRSGLSLAAAAMGIALGLFAIGILENTRTRVRDEHVFLVFAVIGVLWTAGLIMLWWTYRRFRRWVRSAVLIVAIVAIDMPLIAAAFEAGGDAEFFAAGLMVAGIGAVIAVIATAAYRGAPAGVVDATGTIRVQCPQCRYSLVGLESTTCPECGTTFTLDALIRAQPYAERAEDVSVDEDADVGAHAELDAELDVRGSI